MRFHLLTPFHHLRLATAALMLCSAVPAIAAGPVDPVDYPRLSATQLSVVRDLVDRSQLPLADWPRSQFGYGPFADSQNPSHSDLIYQMRADATALAQAQYDKLPAYRELLQRSQDQLIQKMLDPAAWGSWYELSRWEDGITFAQGGGQVKPWADPFLKHNIMYSGNLFQMLGYYGMLYRDRKYEAPGSLTYVWDRATARQVDADYDGEPQVFRYDFKRIGQALRRQYQEGDYVGIACQPKYAFTLCNEVPILAYRHYDLLLGTRYAPEVQSKFMKGVRWDPRTQRFMIFVNQQTKEPFFVSPEKQLAGDPIGGMYWHHPINKALVQKSYEYHRDIALQFYLGNVRDAIRDSGIGFGFFANYAAELGDLDSRNKMLAYADVNFAAVGKDQVRRCTINEVPLVEAPREKHFEQWQSDGEKFGKRIVFGAHGCSLMAMALLNEGGSQWRLYNRPWTAAHFAQPFISGVEYPRTLVDQAVFDARKDALVVGLLPGRANAGVVTVDVNQLDVRKSYVVEVDGKAVGTLVRGSAQGEALTWSPDRVLTVRLKLDAARSLVVRSVPRA
jgi:hypothetical protein